MFRVPVCHLQVIYDDYLVHFTLRCVQLVIVVDSKHVVGNINGTDCRGLYGKEQKVSLRGCLIQTVPVPKTELLTLPPIVCDSRIAYGRATSRKISAVE